MRTLDVCEIAQELKGTNYVRYCTDRATLMETLDDQTEWIAYHKLLDLWVVYKD